MADRPGGEERDPPPDGSGRAVGRLRVLDGGGRGRRAEPVPPASPREVAERLTRLERRVEEALGAARAAGGTDVLREATDRALAVLAALRRRSVSEALRALGVAGLDGAAVERAAVDAVSMALYRYWWRVEAVGRGRVPADGPVVLAANRSGALLPYEALMIRAALEREPSGARPVRALVDGWTADVPVLGATLAQAGAVQSTSAARRALERAEALVVFPEGPRALAKPFRSRYRLAGFGRGTFARLALEAGAPIVPVAVIGAEEVHPVIARFDLPGRILGLPTVPITPTFPWLGLWGLVPLPTKWTLVFGEPLDVGAEAVADARAVARVRDRVRERLQALVLEGLRRRRSVFLG
jgi:1-acyl-sn-glycerol-3-phosphate acyltransferase